MQSICNISKKVFLNMYNITIIYIYIYVNATASSRVSALQCSWPFGPIITRNLYQSRGRYGVTKCPFVGPGGRCNLLPITLVAEPDRLKNRCLEVLKLQEELGAQHPCPLDPPRPPVRHLEEFAISLVNGKTIQGV